MVVVVTQGTTTVKRIVAQGTTIVKSITVGVPTKSGVSALGNLANLGDVNNAGRDDNYILAFDSATSKYIHVDPQVSSRNAISAVNAGGDGELLYNSTTGAFTFYGLSNVDYREKFAANDGLVYDSSSGTFSLGLVSDVAGDYGTSTSIPQLTIDTQGRVSSISSVNVNGINGLSFDSAEGKILITTPSGDSYSTVISLDLFNTGNLTEGSNLYYTTARADSAFDARLALASTDSLSEGSNLYYTDARVQTKLASVSGHIVPDTDITYDLGDSNLRFRDLYLSGSSITLGGITLTDSDTKLAIKDSNGIATAFDLSANTTDDVVEGLTNLYYTDARADSSARYSITLQNQDSDITRYFPETGILRINDSNLARTDIQDVYHSGLSIPDNVKIQFCDGNADIFENNGNFFLRKTDLGLDGDLYLVTNTNRKIILQDYEDNHLGLVFEDSVGVNVYGPNSTLRLMTDDSAVTTYGNQYVHGNSTIYGTGYYSGNVTITGNLQVDGTTTTINSSNLSVNDKNIVLADSAADSSAANGAGITVAGANATITYTAATDTWDLNKPLGTTRNLITNYSTTDLSEGNNLYYTTSRADSAIDDRVTKTFIDALNVDADTLDSISSESFLRSDVADTKTTGDLGFADNVKLTFGASEDLQIYHNGVSNIIEDAGTGGLTLRGNNVYLQDDASGGYGLFAQGLNNGAFEIYYDNSKRLETSSTGVIVTGQAVMDSATISGNLDVSGVFTTITTTGLTEGNNLYYTTARVDSAFDVRLALASTDSVAEGSTNLYYTTSRADSAFDVRLATKSTTDLAEGDNLYYTTARWDARLSEHTTDSITEGTTNIFYTTARFDSDFNDKSTTNLSEGSNLYYTTGRVDSAFDVRLATKNTNDLAEGTTNRYYTRSRFDSDLQSISTNLIPDTDSGYDIGTDALRFRDLYLSGNSIYLGTMVLHESNGQLAIRDSQGDPMTFVLSNNTTDDLPQGSTNLYYDSSRTIETARHSISTSGDLTYDATTGVMSIDVDQIYTFEEFDSDFTQRLVATNTDSLAEGSTNLYYTSDRADADARNAISVVDNGGDGSLSYTIGTGVISYTGPSASEVRSHFSSGPDITYDSSTGRFSLDVSDIYSKADFDSDLGDANTGQLPEGSNLYYTTSRVDSAFDVRFALASTDSLSEGSTNLYFTDARARGALTGGNGIVISSGDINMDSTYDATFNTVTISDGIINSTPDTVTATSPIFTVLDSFYVGTTPQSFEYLVHLQDSSNSETQVTKMLGTWNGSAVASNEYGTVLTGNDYLGELDITDSAGNIQLIFKKASGLGNVNTKATKTILK